MTDARRSSLGPRRERRFLTWLCAFARVLSLFICFELSGLERGFVELLSFFEDTQVHCDDCEDDTPNDCPPGCPACHCTSSAIAVLQAPLESEPLGLSEYQHKLTMTDAAWPPKAPELPGVFRPPRVRTVAS